MSKNKKRYNTCQSLSTKILISLLFWWRRVSRQTACGMMGGLILDYRCTRGSRRDLPFYATLEYRKRKKKGFSTPFQAPLFAVDSSSQTSSSSSLFFTNYYAVSSLLKRLKNKDIISICLVYPTAPNSILQEKKNSTHIITRRHLFPEMLPHIWNFLNPTQHRNY